MALINSLTADFEHAAIGSSPNGAHSTGGWQRVSTDRTLVVDNPRRRGTRCCRVDLRSGDDPINSTGIRCEWTDFRDTDEAPDSNHEAWYATSFMLPDGTKPYGRDDPKWEGGSQWCTVLQLHHAGSTGTQPWGIRADRNWSTGNPQRLWIDFRGGSGTQTLFRILDPLPLGVWIDLIFYIRYSSSSGACRLYSRVGSETSFTLRIDSSGFPNHYAGDAGGYRKGGIYAGDESIAKRIVYHHGYVRRQSFDECAAWFGSSSQDPVTTPAPAEDANRFGVDDSGGGMQNSQPDSQRGSVFTLGSTRKIPRMKVWMDGAAATSGTQPHKAMIYRQSDKVLVATSDEVSIAAGASAAWVAFPFATPPELAAADYRLHLISGGSAAVARYGFRQESGDILEWNNDSYADGPLNPWAPHATAPTDSKLLSIYAVTETPSGSALDADVVATPTIEADLTYGSTTSIPADRVVGFQPELSAAERDAMKTLSDSAHEILVMVPCELWEIDGTVNPPRKIQRVYAHPDGTFKPTKP